MDHVRDIMCALGISLEITDFVPLTPVQREDPQARRTAIRRWKHTLVVPAVRAAERAWFAQQLAALNTEGRIPYGELLPLGQPWLPGMRWASWGKSMWRLFRA